MSRSLGQAAGGARRARLRRSSPERAPQAAAPRARRASPSAENRTLRGRVAGDAWRGWSPFPPVVEARCSASLRRCLIAPTMRLADGGGVAKAHFGFRRMDVDVDFGWIAFDEQSRDRMPVRRQEIEIGAPERAGERLVAHRAPVDEQELLGGVRPADRSAGRRGRRASAPSRRASSATELPGEVVAERLAQPLGEARLRPRPRLASRSPSRDRSRTKSGPPARPSPGA